MNEPQPAKGQKGFLLYNPFEKRYFFRVYDSENKRKFADYKLCAEDIEIEIIDDRLELYAQQETETSEIMPEEKTVCLEGGGDQLAELHAENSESGECGKAGSVSMSGVQRLAHRQQARLDYSRKTLGKT